MMRILSVAFIISMTVLESFEDYVSVETLDGENKYDAGDHGLQVSSLLHEPDTLHVYM